MLTVGDMKQADKRDGIEQHGAAYTAVCKYRRAVNISRIAQHWPAYLRCTYHVGPGSNLFFYYNIDSHSLI